MRLLCFLILIILSPVLCQAQATITISGKIVDKETNDPLIFASVGIKGESISTVSNALGEFDFHIPADYKNKILVIRMLGYENVETNIRSLPQQDTIIFALKKAVQLLDEVVIQDSLSGGDIVGIAFSRIDQNFPTTPFLLDGFYRDLKKIGGTYYSLLEAAVKIYDEDYKEPRNKYRLRERVALVEVRKSYGYNNKFTNYFDQNNLLEDLLLNNNIRYRQFPDAQEFYDDFKRERITYYNGHRVFVVAASRDYSLKLYIDTKSYAIIRLELEQIYPKDYIIKRKNKAVSKYISDRKVIDFKEYEGKMYLNYMKLISKVNWYDAKTDTLKFETELYQELLINEIHTSPEHRIANTRKMRRYGLQYQDEKYNKSFWENYNVIKDTPLDKEIMADLERQGNLEDQFDY
ncbi:carboxypeptidase-like regulatory domain-containing protein [Fulvivirga sediminis]|uniref:Carboxypeptidase-like regulatory domain-containing protein n=1 Tax=Fulvivirga sediminis TaxID=2803949 RepID=A0A937F6Z2_9BACT|nr:carboxypeptidase-like regulatory domain-containing protein [Fulvivirga sediminis]MBL3656885.1 carboxypeptidase-like regulatory domain-containing protein [Fulvivirga sediminis]